MNPLFSIFDGMEIDLKQAKENVSFLKQKGFNVIHIPLNTSHQKKVISLIKQANECTAKRIKKETLRIFSKRCLTDMVTFALFKLQKNERELNFISIMELISFLKMLGDFKTCNELLERIDLKEYFKTDKTLIQKMHLISHIQLKNNEDIQKIRNSPIFQKIHTSAFLDEIMLSTQVTIPIYDPELINAHHFLTEWQARLATPVELLFCLKNLYHVNKKLVSEDKIISEKIIFKDSILKSDDQIRSMANILLKRADCHIQDLNVLVAEYSDQQMCEFITRKWAGAILLLAALVDKNIFRFLFEIESLTGVENLGIEGSYQAEFFLKDMNSVDRSHFSFAHHFEMFNELIPLSNHYYSLNRDKVPLMIKVRKMTEGKWDKWIEEKKLVEYPKKGVQQSNKDRLHEYDLPSDHLVRKKLDHLFESKDRVISDEALLANAVFEVMPKIKVTQQVTLATHPLIEGFIFKIYIDSQFLISDYPCFTRRIEGAKLIKNLIKKHHYSHLFRVPNKWLYKLPNSPPPKWVVFDNVKSHILVIERLDTLSLKENTLKWYQMNSKELLDSILQIAIEAKALILSQNNLLWCKDGTLAIIDTESVNMEKIPFSTLDNALNPTMKKYWKKITTHLA